MYKKLLQFRQLTGTRLNKRSWIHQTWFYAVLAIAIVLSSCDSTGTDGISSVTDNNQSLSQVQSVTPTAANDGLTLRDISGIAATNFVTAGTGTASEDVETISVDVPADATIEEVYLYWARRGSENDPSEPKITVEGSEYTGSIIGGPVDMHSDEHLAPVSYRVDLTGEGIVAPGSNSVEVQDNFADTESLGASLLIFYSLSSEESELMLFDGVDFFWADATAPTSDQQDALQNAEPITFSFDAASTNRTAELTLFIGDVELADRTERPNSLKITIDGVTTTYGSDGSSGEPLFQSFQGAEWDNYIQSIEIPAGVSEVTVEPISGTGTNPASLVWSMAGLSVPVLQQEGGQGCTPGYWKQSHHFDSWNTYAPGDDLNDPFDVPVSLDLERPEQGKAIDLTLLEGLELRGGKVNALIRHAVAALLNASNPDVSYDLSVAEVISKFNDAVDGGDIQATKNEFESFNEQGCPLD